MIGSRLAKPLARGLFRIGWQQSAEAWDLAFAGSIPLVANDPDKMRNSSLVYSPAGECVKRYDKIHPFGLEKGDESHDEAAFIEAGDQPVTCRYTVRSGRAFDLLRPAIPELYRALGAVDLILMPAAFTDTTAAHTGRFCCAPEQPRTNAICSLSDKTGRHEWSDHGNSMIVDPWGEILDRKNERARDRDCRS